MHYHSIFEVVTLKSHFEILEFWNTNLEVTICNGNLNILIKVNTCNDDFKM